MAVLSIHNLDALTESKIREIAQRDGRSMNQVMQDLLRKAVGVFPAAQVRDPADFADVFGFLSSEEADELERRCNEERSIDPGDWK